jgi:D-sedoheptulose 7-phosphate isomerase
MKKQIIQHIDNLIKTLEITKKDTSILEKISNLLIKKIKNKKKIFVYGNGGSYADSSHFVGELTATYKKKRKPLPFILLGSNMASVSAWANDFRNDLYISRELSGYGNTGDLLIVLSTSGGNIKKKQSTNLIKLAKVARQKKITLISFLGRNGGALKKISNINYIVKSNYTATIQETHKTLLHSICEIIDKRI